MQRVASPTHTELVGRRPACLSRSTRCLAQRNFDGQLEPRIELTTQRLVDDLSCRLPSLSRPSGGVSYLFCHVARWYLVPGLWSSKVEVLTPAASSTAVTQTALIPSPNFRIHQHTREAFSIFTELITSRSKNMKHSSNEGVWFTTTTNQNGSVWLDSY